MRPPFPSSKAPDGGPYLTKSSCTVCPTHGFCCGVVAAPPSACLHCSALLFTNCSRPLEIDAHPANKTLPATMHEVMRFTNPPFVRRQPKNLTSSPPVRDRRVFVRIHAVTPL